MPAVDLLFVYGTLRRGGGMEPLLEGARRLCHAEVDGKLLDLGEYPALVPAAAGTVRGELVLLPEPVDGWLRFLDEYEGAEYERVRREARAEDGTTYAAWVYVLRAAYVDGSGERIPSGDWLAR